MAVRGSEEVILWRPGEPDRYGDATGDAVTLAIFEKCVVWPRTSTEAAVEGTVITEGYNVWVPWGPNAEEFTVLNEELDDMLEIEGTDVVVVRNREWQVVGTPADQRNMRGRRLGLQMVVGRIA